MGAFEQEVVPEPAADRFDRLVRRSWHPVALADEVGDGPVAVTLAGHPLVLVRGASGVRAFTDVCIHRGAALSLGEVVGGCLRCPFHGWVYEASTGACVEIPSQRDRPVPPRAALTGHHTAEHLGLVWVSLEEPVTPLPEFPEFSDPRFRTVVCPPYDWDCSASRRVENFLDFAHFAWVHPGTLGDPDHPEVPEHDVWREGDELRVRQPRPEPRNDDVKTMGLDADAEVEAGGRIQSMMHYRGYPPFAAQLRQELPAGREYAVFLAASPLDEHRTRTFWHVARTYALDEPDDTFVQFQVDVVAQDRPIVESQRPERIPADITAELHVRDDKVSLAWRRLLLELADRASGSC